MYLVSEPQSLVLTRDPVHHNHESTLVEPLLPTPRLHYSRCLVDTGPQFEEHAVVLAQEDDTALSFRLIVERALSAARTTAVSFVLLDGDESRAIAADGAKCSLAALSACATCWVSKQGGLEATGSIHLPWAKMRVSRLERFYGCETDKPST